ncbi:sensor domain-containing diguanylate cyclase [Nitrosomonas ureae]|uniref:diguanylate cyclase n=1 Tax=Nitrosomonas ureae TaxID=44577 RepID=A0A1H2ECB8_9PROT|nr:diguanylate cyclase [Nitrosomonas ureae]ALQ52300.1 diguanylate cyclase [Nitrosomonas ureae]SDT92751.1 diguanylate cyclase (GGDEF) domain-containing protein [Nitrosomonas ureae]
MKKISVLLTMMLVCSFWSLPADAQDIDVSKKYQEPIGQHIQFYRNEEAHLSMQSAYDAFQNGDFSQSSDSVLNFGIGAKPVWLAFRVRNHTHDYALRNLLLETSWLDKIDVYHFHGNQLVNSYHIGDSQLFSQRPLNHRFFVTEHNVGTGDTTVLIRVESDDAMVLPIYFLTAEETADRNMLQAYSYGLIYGIILALVAYNFMLYIGLRSAPYFFYSLYLLLFLLLNAAYTGHGYQWLWPDSPHWQQWSNPVLIMMCTLSGCAFALNFLDIKTASPRIYQSVIVCCLSFSVLTLIAILTDKFIITLFISLFFIFYFYILAVILGIISLRTKNRFAQYFLLASIFTICGGIITANAVWGFIPFNWLTYRATEIGMVADAILLALALAERFNINQSEKLAAEKRADIDLLTNLNNRRAFYKFVQPMWAISLRSKSSTSVIILDIDDFKLLNDNYGHPVGDLVLVRLAETIQKEARSGDILARWGGEEFLIFLPETQLTDAIAIADRMRKRITTIQISIDNDEKVSFTASFGVATTQDINVSLNELIAQADRQLYHAKKKGRNRVYPDLSD